MLAGDILIAAVFFLPLLKDLSGAILADDIFGRTGDSDAFNFLWGYWWVQKAMSLGVSPLHTAWVLPPEGVDLRFHTLPLLPAVLSWPVGRVVGTVAAYNLTVLALLIGGAFSVQWLLRRAFGFSWASSFAAGALFGFAPYFVFKAHAHVNLVGGAFWATALGALVVALRDRDFRFRRGLGLALAVWACFFSSLVEFAMLALLLPAFLALLLAFDASDAGNEARGRPGLSALLSFLLPTALGAVSLLPYISSGDQVGAPLYQRLGPGNLFNHPALGALASVPSSPEFRGTALPMALWIPALVGAALAFRDRRRAVAPFGVMAIIALLLTVDPMGVPSSLLRTLPMAQGLRVFGRFFPFFMFFLCPFVALALDRLGERARTGFGGRVLAVLLLALAAIEYYPAGLRPSAVRGRPPVARFGGDIDHSRRVLVVPRGDYRQVHDTWQIALDAPSVLLSFVAREAPASRNVRLSTFSLVYSGEPVDLSDPAALAEVRKLGVRYVLIENRRLPPPPGGAEVARWEIGRLFDLEPRSP